MRGVMVLTEEQLLAVLTAVANPQRLRVIAELTGGRIHVSELARRLGMSRPLLYMHLDKLEKAGLVAGQLELSGDGKAMKYFELAPFEVRVTADTIAAALAASAAGATTDGTGPDGSAAGRDGHTADTDTKASDR
jgi:DNA-binding transcriptional ArsR family regulator